MTGKLVTIIGAIFMLLTAVVPAMAGTTAPLPEPATISLFGLGVAGAFIAKKFVGRS